MTSGSKHEKLCRRYFAVFPMASELIIRPEMFLFHSLYAGCSPAVGSIFSSFAVWLSLKDQTEGQLLSKFHDSIIGRITITPLGFPSVILLN